MIPYLLLICSVGCLGLAWRAFDIGRLSSSNGLKSFARALYGTSVVFTAASIWCFVSAVGEIWRAS